MPQGWRIVKAKHAPSAFSGAGAAKYGGRWNSRGVPMVYTSGTKSLAALETLVHLNPPVLFAYLTIRIEFDKPLLEHLSPDDLPRDWRLEPPPRSTRAIGDDWVRRARSAVLAVPSVIVEGEPNYLLNPTHSDFPRISIRKPERFAFDPRLIA